MRAFKLSIRVMLIVTVLAVVSSFSVKDSYGAAPEYLGDFCWEIDENLVPPPTFIIKLGITYIGSNHFQFSGDGGGYGDVVGTSVNVVLYKASDDEDVYTGGFRTGIINATLSTATLNGTWRVIDHVSNGIAGGAVIHEYSDGTMTLVACP